VYNGTQADVGLGICVAAVGDTNADGVIDILLSEPGYAGPAGPISGRVRVRSGQGTAILLMVHGTVQDSAFGNAVAGAGDLNGDGHDDIAVGAWFENNPAGFWAGAVYAFSGSNGDVLWKREGDGLDHHLGTSVAIVRDVNADGFDDVAVGQPGRDFSTWPDPGRVYVLSGFDGSPLYHLDGGQPGDEFGWRVSAIDDVDGDGVNDIVVGAPSGDGNVPNAGNVRIFSGATGQFLRFLGGDSIWENFGAAVAGLDDLDGDGFGDLAIGAYNYGNVVMTYIGRVCAFSGASGDLLWSFDGLSQGEVSGKAVGRAGDVNRDGVTDVIIGAPYTLGDLGPWQGRVYVRSGVDGSLIDMWMGESGSSFFGHSVSGAGDLNQDGYDDVMVGAPDQTGFYQQSGRMYLYRGGPNEDLTCDSCVDVDDLLTLIVSWGDCAGDDPVCRPDIDNDDDVDVDDRIAVILGWTGCD
jgi:hypothetical protein